MSELFEGYVSDVSEELGFVEVRFPEHVGNDGVSEDLIAEIEWAKFPAELRSVGLLVDMTVTETQVTFKAPPPLPTAWHAVRQRRWQVAKLLYALGKLRWI